MSSLTKPAVNAWCLNIKDAADVTYGNGFGSVVEAYMKKLLAFFLLFTVGCSLTAATNNSPSVQQRAITVDSLDIAPVWAGHPVGFALLTHAPHQFVAFYDEHRQLTVAERRLDESQWKFTKLPDTTGWDSHNYIVLTADKDGFLHLSADMHAEKGSVLYFAHSTQFTNVLKRRSCLWDVKAAVQAVSGKPKPGKFTPPPVFRITFHFGSRICEKFTGRMCTIV